MADKKVGQIKRQKDMFYYVDGTGAVRGKSRKEMAAKAKIGKKTRAKKRAASRARR